jgi:hypothetical protein
MAATKLERRRDGAYRWGVYEDTAEQGRFVETFVVASWIEHLRRNSFLSYGIENITRAPATSRPLRLRCDEVGDFGLIG